MSSDLSLATKKKRNSNFSRDEVFCMVGEYGKRLNVLNFGNREQKQICWQEITNEINELHNDFTRSVEEIKKKWIDLLYATKKEYVKASKEATAKGQKRKKLTDISELIVKVRGGFSTNRNKMKPESNGVHIINLQIPTPAEGSDHPTTIYIPHVDECHSSASESVTMQDGSSSVVIHDPTSFADLNMPQGTEATVVESVSFENYDTTNAPSSPSAPRGCSCGLSLDILRLKQDALGIQRRRIQLEEERRLEERQKWWEEKSILRLQKQKLELEIKQLQISLRQAETARSNATVS